VTLVLDDSRFLTDRRYREEVRSLVAREHRTDATEQARNLAIMAAAPAGVEAVRSAMAAFPAVAPIDVRATQLVTENGHPVPPAMYRWLERQVAEVEAEERSGPLPIPGVPRPVGPGRRARRARPEQPTERTRALQQRSRHLLRRIAVHDIDA
jgi:hypothetical protein